MCSYGAQICTVESFEQKVGSISAVPGHAKRQHYAWLSTFLNRPVIIKITVLKCILRNIVGSLITIRIFVFNKKYIKQYVSKIQICVEPGTQLITTGAL